MGTIAPIAGFVIAAAVFAGLAAAQDTRPAPNQTMQPGRDHGDIGASSPSAAILQGLSFTKRADGRIFVAEQGGAVKILNQDGSVNERPFLNAPTADLLGLEGPKHVLYSIAFHPDFQDNGHVFAHYAPQPFNGEGVIIRFTVDPARPDAITAERARETAEVVLRIDTPPMRQVGSIRFSADGWLSLSHPLGRRRLLGPEELGGQ